MSSWNVVVVPYDARWADEFASESARLRESLEDLDVEIHHIGSTAIPGILAKPIIDILILVQDVERLDDRNAAMISLGYEPMGELGIAGRRYFRKSNADGVRTHHVHAFERKSPAAERHLAFRDYMRLHLDAAQAYSSLKQYLTSCPPCTIEAYMDGKDAFIKHHEALALEWRSRGRAED